jgi:periplasmic protein TonB
MNGRWGDAIAHGLIGRAARKAPATLAPRLEEEWRADLAVQCGELARLRFALGCCWAAVVIARELAVPVRAAATPAGHKVAVICADPGPSFFSRRTLVVALIIGLHALVIYGLATGVVDTALTAIPGRIEVVFLPRTTPRLPPPPDFSPQLAHFTAHIDPPPWTEVSLQPQVTPPPVNPDLPSEPSAPLPTRPVSRVTGGPGAGFPNTDDFYPAAARRLGESGITTVSVCVDGAGRLTGKPTIAATSGSALLDAGALGLARAGSGHYRPTTEDGSPVSACYAFRVRFELRD